MAFLTRTNFLDVSKAHSSFWAGHTLLARRRSLSPSPFRLCNFRFFPHVSYPFSILFLSSPFHGCSCGRQQSAANGTHWSRYSALILCPRRRPGQRGTEVLLAAGTWPEAGRWREARVAASRKARDVRAKETARVSRGGAACRCVATLLREMRAVGAHPCRRAWPGASVPQTPTARAFVRSIAWRKEKTNRYHGI
jgi:hypothetical protein